MASLQTGVVSSRRGLNNGKDKSHGKRSLKMTSPSGDPAAVAITSEVAKMMKEAWASEIEVVKTISVPGGHLINKIEIQASREGNKTRVQVLGATPCERIKKPRIRHGEELVAALQKIIVNENLGVNPKKLERSLVHNAQVFANALLRKVHEMEHDRSEKAPKRARQQRRRTLTQEQREQSEGDEGNGVPTSLPTQPALELPAQVVNSPAPERVPGENGALLQVLELANV